MKNLFIIAFVLFGLIPITSCDAVAQKRISGNGKVEKEIREVNTFSGVSASSGINVYLFQSDEKKVIVEADENLLECIVTKVKGDVLHCTINCSVRRSRKLNIYVSVPEINSVSASSGASVYAETIIQSDELKLAASSGADIKIEIVANKVNASASSGADIVINGNCAEFNGQASSAGDIKARGLTAAKASMSASSAGDIQLTVTESVKASASSGGDVVYYGNPEVLSVSQSSGGDVKQRN